MKPFAGLDEVDARARLLAEGHNELPQPDRRTPFRIAIEVLREPMLALLLVGGIVYLALGDLKEAIILVAFATMSIVITVVQETRTERVLEALRDLTSPRALVIREVSASGSPAATSCGATSSSFPKATGCLPTRCSCSARICRPTNRP
jgi:P-type Ca2+ transporter type 2C